MREPLVPRVSPGLVALFSWYARRYVRRHVHAVRLARDTRPEGRGDGALVVVLNHAAWWDPLVGLVLARSLFPRREHYAPIEAAALDRYRFFARLGFFGIDASKPAGVRTFLRTAEAILAKPRATIWITSQGRFADPRERPTVLREGAGHLARRMAGGRFLPLALEYPFWDERTPEALALFGPALDVANRGDADARAWTERLARGLETAQERLAALAIARDPERFEVVLGGTAGVGGVYDLWRRVRARLRGERFRPGHGDRG